MGRSVAESALRWSAGILDVDGTLVQALAWGTSLEPAFSPGKLIAYPK